MADLAHMSRRLTSLSLSLSWCVVVCACVRLCVCGFCLLMQRAESEALALIVVDVYITPVLQPLSSDPRAKQCGRVVTLHTAQHLGAAGVLCV